MNLFEMEKHHTKTLWLLALLLTFSTVVWAQGTPVTGRVSDEKGELLIGVSVQEKGTTNGTITDTNGQYNLKLTSNNPILIVSYIGYKSQEVKVGKQKVLDVILAEDVSSLDEVVVVAYGHQRKVSVVGAQSSMKIEDIKMPTANLSSAIAGRLPGVVAVQRSGEPGHDDSDLWIRGISTLAGQNSKPLVLVDGVERSFNNIDPEDIESFTVLKDASATAVYGVRGANGVILIKTKPGKVGKPQFSVDYYEGFVTLTKKPEMADAFTYMDAANEAYMDTRGSMLYSPQYIEATKKAHGLLPNDNPLMFNPYLYPNVDWMNELFNDWGHNRRVNVSVRGGVPNATYYVSLSYYNEKGLTRTAEMENYDANIRYDRYNYTANLNLKPTETTTIDLGFNGFLSMGNYPQQSTSDLFASAMEINPVYLPLMMPDGSVPGISTNGDLRNPYADLTRRGYKNEARNQLNSNIRLTQDLGFWKWSKGLTASAMLAFDVHNSRDLKYNKREDTYNFAGTKDENGLWNDDVFDADGNYRYALTYTGHKDLAFDQGASDSRSTYFEASLNYDRSFGLHRIGGLLLYNQKIYRLSSDNLIGSLPYKQQGLAARATYSWNDRYFFEANLGYNGSENFSPEKRFGFFPAFSAGWVVSNERFLEKNKTITNLKLRASYGKVGNDQLGSNRFLYLDDIQMASGVIPSLGRGQSISINKKGNPDVGWEIAYKQNYGVDIQLFNELSFSFDYFRERREDILIQRSTVPELQGLPLSALPKVNMGMVHNSGFELEVGYNRKLNKDFSFGVKGNFSYNKNKIDYIDETCLPEEYAYPYRKTGYSIGQIFGYKIDYSNGNGYINTVEELEWAKKTYKIGTPRMGDLLYKDVNGDGDIDPEDISPIKYSNIPRITYGFSGNLSWRNLDFSFLFSGVAKVSKYYSNFGVTEIGLVGFYTGYHLNAWTAERYNSGRKIEYPALSANTTTSMTANDFFVMDRSFLRLKNIELGYTLPKLLLEKIKIQKLRIYVSGNNLLTFKKMKLNSIDPEQSSETAYPVTKMVSFGANVTF